MIQTMGSQHRQLVTTMKKKRRAKFISSLESGVDSLVPRMLKKSPVYAPRITTMLKYTPMYILHKRPIHILYVKYHRSTKENTRV